METRTVDLAEVKDRKTLEMIKFEHTVFALPFALIGALLASGGLPRWWQLAWILVAMVGARSAAMAFNRLVDVDFDRQNPRTQERALAKGVLTVRFAVLFTIVRTSGIFVLAAWGTKPAMFLPIISGFSIYLFLFLYTKTIYFAESSRAGFCYWLCTPGGVDRDSRKCELGSRVAQHCGHVLDRRV